MTEAALKAPPLRLEAQVSGSSLVIKALPPKAHHINKDAPMSVTVGDKTYKPTEAKESGATFRLPSTDDAKLVAMVYLCDDAKTFCEKHRVSAEWTKAGSKLQQSAAAPGTPQAATEGTFKMSKKPDHHGFLLNSPDEAMALAKSRKLPLLIDFFGIWCPPCNEYDSKVFSTSEFKKSGARFVKLRLDADAPISWAFKSRYKIGGYPTIIFAASDGDEISRVVGYRERSLFLKEMDHAWSERDHSFTKLLAQAAAGDRAAADQVGLTCLERREFADAARFLDKSALHREQWYAAEIGRLEDEESAGNASAKPVRLATIEKSIAQFATSPESLGLRSQLAELYDQRGERGDKDKSKATTEALIKLAEDIVAHPAPLDNHDLAVADVWVAIAEARAKLGDDAGAKAAYKSAAAAYEADVRKDPKGSGLNRGQNLERAYCLWNAGLHAEADALYAKLEKAYPTEFTYWFAHARMQQSLKDLPKAEQLARKAMEFAYGDNRLRVTALYLKVLRDQGKKDEARQVADAELAQASIPDDKTIRTHRYVKAIEDVRRTL